MNTYIAIKALHILAAFALVGPLLLTPRWLYLYRHQLGRSALHELHQVVGIGGWIVLLSGIIMLVLQGGAMLGAFWMRLSITLFLAAQIFDHFWADRQETKLETNPDASTSALKVWLAAKLGVYGLIAILMVVKA